jgi:hypothetical protein
MKETPKIKFVGDLTFAQWEEVEERDHQTKIFKAGAWVHIRRKQLEEASEAASAAHLTFLREQLAFAEDGLKSAEKGFEVWKQRDPIKAFAEHAFERNSLFAYRKKHGPNAAPPEREVEHEI